MKKKISGAALLFLWMGAFLSFTSCMTIDITELEIKKVEVALLHGYSFVKGSWIVPGESYRVKIRVHSADRGLIEHPDYRNFIIKSPNNSVKVIRQDNEFLEIKADYDVLRLAESGLYTLEIGVANNPRPKQTFRWGIDWEGYNRLDYAGPAGPEK